MNCKALSMDVQLRRHKLSTHRQPFRSVPLPRVLTVVRAQKNDFMENVRRVAMKVQGALPIVGLVSRLASAEGGFDELSYAEFSRGVYEKRIPGFVNGQRELEKAHGKYGAARWILLLLWMTKMGTGIVPGKDIVNAARRLRVTQDMEVEIDRFEIARAAVVKKYEYVAPPEPKPRDLATTAVDALATLALGVKDGQPIPEAEAAAIAGLVAGVFGEAGVTDELAGAIVRERPQRALMYT